jgi:hypothetical protein
MIPGALARSMKEARFSTLRCAMKLMRKLRENNAASREGYFACSGSA